LIFSLGLFLYLFSGEVQATESYWEVVKGENKVTKFEVMPWFGPSPYIYTIPNNKDEIVFAPYTRFYIEPWTPQGKKEGQYVWKLNINTFSTDPILYEKFMTLKPQLQVKPTKISEKLVKQPREYNLAKDTPSDETVIEAIKFNTKSKKYEVKLYISKFNKFKRNRFGIRLIDNKTTGQKKGIYYSGIMHLRIFEISASQPLVDLKKQFKDWSYPLRNDPKKYTIPSIIASFCKLYLLPDSRPCFMLSSPVYKGRIYKEYKSVEDETFSLIIP
jgi:hypothetical protein